MKTPITAHIATNMMIAITIPAMAPPERPARAKTKSSTTYFTKNFEEKKPRVHARRLHFVYFTVTLDYYAYNRARYSILHDHSV